MPDWRTLAGSSGSLATGPSPAGGDAADGLAPVDRQLKVRGMSERKAPCLERPGRSTQHVSPSGRNPTAHPWRRRFRRKTDAEQTGLPASRCPRPHDMSPRQQTDVDPLSAEIQPGASGLRGARPSPTTRARHQSSPPQSGTSDRRSSLSQTEIKPPTPTPARFFRHLLRVDAGGSVRQ
jgi:hypothetical protein